MIECMTVAFGMSKLDFCEGESFPTAIFNSDTQLSVYSCACFIFLCPFVALLKATYAENSHIVLCCQHQKAFMVNLLCVLICFLERQQSSPLSIFRCILFISLSLSNQSACHEVIANSRGEMNMITTLSLHEIA